MPTDDHYWFSADEMEAVADFLPREVQTDQQKIDALLGVLASGFEGDEDLDLVRDSALACLLQFPQLPERAIGIMQGILADEDDSELALNRKVAAFAVLSHMGAQAKPVLATMIALLPLAESERNFKTDVG